MSAPQVRLARAEDLQQLPVIERAAAAIFPAGRIPDPQATLPIEHLEKAMRQELLFVADLAGAVTGFATSHMENQYLHLDEMSVHPEYGRQGIGTALLRRVIAESAARNLLGVTLTTFSDLAWNAPFYRRMGFSQQNAQALPRHVARHLDQERIGGLSLRVGMVYSNPN